MRRIAITLLLTAASAFAQSQNLAQNQTQTQTQNTCPVNLYAQRQSQPILQSAGEAAKQAGSQTLHVTVNRAGAPPIVAIEATLHGLSADPQVLPVAAHTARDLTKTFHLERKTGEDSLTSFDLRMSRAGVLRWVDVTSITYADGTTWNTPQVSLCRAAPSPFTLVASASK